MKLAVLALTKGGEKLARKLSTQLDNCTLIAGKGKISVIVKNNWPHYDGFIFIMATGIVVRAIAPLLHDKSLDPCVVVMDEKGTHVISLLSGHIGGGNVLAGKVAERIGATPVITTSSDTLNLVALDLWLAEQHVVAENKKQLTLASAKLVNNGQLTIFTDMVVDSLPASIIPTDNPRQADMAISPFINETHPDIVFRPVNIVIGTGCNRGTPAREFEEALTELLSDLHLSRHSVRNLASIDKKNDEAGLIAFAENNNWPIDFFDNRTINDLKNVEISFAALKGVGAIGVAEPAAILSSGNNQLISRKRKWKNITMAVAQVPFSLSAQVQDRFNT